MSWTKTPPAARGYYWWKEKKRGEPFVVLLSFVASRSPEGWIYNGPYSANTPKKYGGGRGWWAGPLRAPTLHSL